MIRMETAESEISPFYSTHSSSLSKPGACITHKAVWPLGDITGGNVVLNTFTSKFNVGTVLHYVLLNVYGLKMQNLWL